MAVATKRAAPTPRKRVVHEPEWITLVKKVSHAEIVRFLNPDISVVEGDTVSSATEFHLKLVVEPAHIRPSDEWVEVTVRLDDLSVPAGPTTFPWHREVPHVVNTKGGEYPLTINVPVPPDARFDPDFHNEVRVEVDTKHTFPDRDRSNNVLQFFGTTIG